MPSKSLQLPKKLNLLVITLSRANTRNGALTANSYKQRKIQHVSIAIGEKKGAYRFGTYELWECNGSADVEQIARSQSASFKQRVSTTALQSMESGRHGSLVLIALVRDITLSVVRLHDVEQSGGGKQCGKVFCAIVARINRRLSLRGVTG